MTSIGDIARRSGVSTQSVSRVLEGSRRVRLATRERVLRAVVELQAAAQTLTPERRSGTIGLIVGDVENPFFHQVIGSIENTSYSAKRRLVLCNSDEDPERERFLLSELVAQGVEGIIIVPVGASAESIKPFTRSQPVVCLDRRIPGLELDLALLDNRLGSALAVRHFADLGHTRLAMIGTQHETSVTERVAGYQTALAKIGLGARAEYVRQGSDAFQHTGYEQMLHLLSLAEPPTAVLVANHLMTLGAMLAIRDRGLRTPQDVSLIGFDDTPWSRLLDPPLTTIAQPADELGKAAASLLIDRLEHNYLGPPKEIMLPPSLVVRSSTCRAARERVA